MKETEVLYLVKVKVVTMVDQLKLAHHIKEVPEPSLNLLYFQGAQFVMFCMLGFL